MAVGLILDSFFRALGQIGDPRFLRILLLGVGLSIAGLIAASAGVMWLLQWLFGDSVTLPWIGTVAWVDDLASWSGFLLMLVLSIFLMVPVASAIVSMFLDTVADAVEDRHYPHLPAARPQPLSEVFADALGFFGIIVVANLLALVFYFTPLAPFVFVGLNGFLLGREYFTLAAMRRLSRDEAKRLRRQHGVKIWLAGALMALPLWIPILNLVVPILGAATFTHIYHGLKARPARD